MQRGETPLMKQYYRIKAEHPGQLLLFRMGDFYETFADDAVTTSKVLGLVLSKRASGRAGAVPLAGFPYHALDNHLPKLVKAGLRVAICEQLEDPKKARTLVKRGVVESVSPGVSVHEHLLTPQKPNYLAAVHWGQGRAHANVVGVAYADISTGEFAVAEIEPAKLEQLVDAIAPSEILVEKRYKGRLAALRYTDFVSTVQDDWIFAPDYSREVLLRHFNTHSLKGFGVEDLHHGQVAAGAILHYLDESQQGRLSHIRKIIRHAESQHMRLDIQTKINLSLVSVSVDGRQDGALIEIMDHTSTAMGARRLRGWLFAPLRSVEAINRRLEAVDELMKRRLLRADIDQRLRNICDMERVVARTCTGRATPRDLSALCASLKEVPHLKALLQEATSDALKTLGGDMDPCTGTFALLSRALVDAPAAKLRDGDVFREGYSEERDKLKALARSGKEFVAKLQQTEMERTDIPSLKVGYNRVFGYYIEITHTHRDKVPAHYIRKQTLVNAERYITPELKEYESQILSAEDQLAELEYELFGQLREAVAEHASALQGCAALVGTLDVYSSFADVAEEHDFSRPFLDDSLRLHIEEGRHPVVEQVVDTFIPNSVSLDDEKALIYLITGPNMAGKSVVLRQTGVIVLLAQAGSFVPAKYAHIGLVDRIFTRVGASDNILSGESTFLVEMNETADILNNATPHSLILLDEVGRGTSTFDGLSIAWALVEHLHENASVAARTLFATHYHELNELAKRYSRVKNYRINVQKHAGKLVFLRKLVPGGADHSYGLEVARMAGLPETILTRANEILRQLEKQTREEGDISHASQEESLQPQAHYVQMNLFTSDTDSRVADQVRELDPDHMTPMEALMALAELKELADSDD